MEIIEYLEYRKAIYVEHENIDFMILNGHDNEIVLTKPQSKESLVHQFLAEKYGMKESKKHALCIQYFRNFLHLLPERTVRSSDQSSAYYVLLFLAHMPHMQRYEVAEFWDVLEATKREAKQGGTGIRHSLRHDISEYIILFMANGLIPVEALLPIIRRKTNPKRVLEIEVRWFDEDAYGIDFLYWDHTSSINTGEG